MANWCVGELKIRGNSENLIRFLTECIEGCTAELNKYGGFGYPKFSKLIKKETKMNLKPIIYSLLFILGLSLAYGLANATESDTTDWERQAKQNWINRHGDTPPNLTAESEKYLEKMTALLQAEKNKERDNDKAK